MPVQPTKQNKLTHSHLIPEKGEKTMNKNTSFSESRLRVRTKETQKKIGTTMNKGLQKQTINKKPTLKKRRMKTYR